MLIGEVQEVYCGCANIDAPESDQPFPAGFVYLQKCKDAGMVVEITNVYYRTYGMWKAKPSGVQAEYTQGRPIVRLRIAQPANNGGAPASSSIAVRSTSSADLQPVEADVSTALDWSETSVRLGFCFVTPHYLVGRDEEELEDLFEAQGIASLAKPTQLMLSQNASEVDRKDDCLKLAKSWEDTFTNNTWAGILPGAPDRLWNVESWDDKGFNMWTSAALLPKPVLFKTEWIEGALATSPNAKWWPQDKTLSESLGGRIEMLWGPPWCMDKLGTCTSNRPRSSARQQGQPAAILGSGSQMPPSPMPPSPMPPTSQVPTELPSSQFLGPSQMSIE